MPRRLLAIAGVVLCAVSPGCGGPAHAPPTFDFRSSDLGWTAGFADVPVALESEVGFVADHRRLPAPLFGSGLYQAGNNVSDDLFIWFAGRAEGFAPGAEYAISFDVGIASNAGAGCTAGIAASTHVKVGALAFAPERVDVDGYWTMNFDHGGPVVDSASALVVGDIRNAIPGCPSVAPPWGERTLSSEGRSIVVRADSAGSIWFFVATDSAFETAYRVYFVFLNVHATRQP